MQTYAGDKVRHDFSPFLGHQYLASLSFKGVASYA